MTMTPKDIPKAFDKPSIKTLNFDKSLTRFS